MVSVKNVVQVPAMWAFERRFFMTVANGRSETLSTMVVGRCCCDAAAVGVRPLRDGTSRPILSSMTRRLAADWSRTPK